MLDALMPSPNAKIKRNIDTHGMEVGFIASFHDNTGASSSKVFPKVGEALKWIMQTQAKSMHWTDPVSGLCHSKFSIFLMCTRVHVIIVVQFHYICIYIYTYIYIYIERERKIYIHL